MTLWAEVLILALLMTLFCLLPLYSKAARAHSRTIFLLGTGAMFGICFFDLIPDVMELGGSSSLYVIGLVWLIYTAIHLLHLAGHHHHDHDPTRAHADLQSGFALFFGSLVAHCLASGMLLTVSYGLSQKIALTVFAALVAHKVYESILLSSILLSSSIARRRYAIIIGVYALALPVGAAAAHAFRAAIDQRIAVWISSVAVGTLIGCLIFDFLLPSFRQLREQRFKIAWILAGLLLTQAVMRHLS